MVLATSAVLPDCKAEVRLPCAHSMAVSYSQTITDLTSINVCLREHNAILRWMQSAPGEPQRLVEKGHRSHLTLQMMPAGFALSQGYVVGFQIVFPLQIYHASGHRRSTMLMAEATEGALAPWSWTALLAAKAAVGAAPYSHVTSLLFKVQDAAGHDKSVTSPTPISLHSAYMKILYLTGRICQCLRNCLSIPLLDCLQQAEGTHMFPASFPNGVLALTMVFRAAQMRCLEWSQELRRQA